MMFVDWSACAPSAEVRPGEVLVSVPAHVLPAGQVVRGSDLTAIPLPYDVLVTGVVVSPADLVGRTATATLLPHEPIRSDRLTRRTGPRGPDADEVFLIAAGRRLEPGETVREDDLYAWTLDRRLVPEHVFLGPEHVVGRIVCERIEMNELVRSERLDDDTGRCPTPP